MARGKRAKQHRSSSRKERGRAKPPCLPVFTPQRALIAAPSYWYPPSSFLGVPQEIRDRIWGYIFKDIKSTVGEQWCTSPTTQYDSLHLVCRQVHHELFMVWPACIVPKHRLESLLKQPFSFSKLHGFKSLSMQVPFNLSEDFFQNLATLLYGISPFLKHLNLSFVGKDAYGTETFLHGCGNTVIPMTQTLPIDGQGFEERHVLINALYWLTKLRTLSIRNPNMPLMQSHVMLHKPHLKKLFIECDPRTSMHIPWRASNCGVGLLVPISGNLPPIKELHLSSNAVLASPQVVKKVSKTLEKLTWLCPNVWRWTGSMVPEVGRDTDSILLTLSTYGHNLHTLKICIEESITEESNDHGVLMGSFRSHLPNMRSLRNLELHLCSRSPWFQTEILEALPPLLKRLYVSDTLMKWDCLVSTIMLRTFGHEEDEGQASKLASIVTRSELARKDFIPMRNNTLTFVSYQYIGRDNECVVIKECHDMDPAVKPEEDPLSAMPDTQFKTDLTYLELLKLNGRLLDRARNQHLARLEPGAYIRPSGGNNKDYANEHAEIEAALKRLDRPTVGETRTNATMLQISRFKDDPEYFGEENEAEAVFLDEEVTTVEMLKELGPRTYPRRVPMGRKDHWVCP